MWQFRLEIASFCFAGLCFSGGYGIYSLYTVQQGAKTIRFPHKVKQITDVFTGKVLGENVDHIKLDMPAHSTIVIYAR